MFSNSIKRGEISPRHFPSLDCILIFRFFELNDKMSQYIFPTVCETPRPVLLLPNPPPPRKLCFPPRPSPAPKDSQTSFIKRSLPTPRERARLSPLHSPALSLGSSHELHCCSPQLAGVTVTLVSWSTRQRSGRPLGFSTRARARFKRGIPGWSGLEELQLWVGARCSPLFMF